MEKDRRGRKKSKLTGGQGIAERRGKILKDIRELINLTQEKMAEEILGLRVDRLSKMERAVKGRGINDQNLIEIIGKLRSNDKLKLDPNTFKKLQDYLDEVPLPKSEIHRKILYHVPSIPYKFLEREKEIRLLLSYLARDSGVTVINLTGINGIGKSYLAIEAAKRCKVASECLQEPSFDAILGYSKKKKVTTQNDEKNSEEIPTNLDQLLLYIIGFLSPKYLKDRTVDKSLEILCREMLSQIRTLLIIETVGEAVDEQVKEFIESLPDLSKVIVIDRNFNFRYQTEIILTAFTPVESIRIIKNISYVCKLKLEEQEESLIADMSGGIPLAIKNIIENISQSNLILNNIGDFLYNKSHSLLRWIFQEAYDRLSSDSRLLLLP